MIDFNTQKVGIVGYGIVGKSIASFVRRLYPEAIIAITDRKEPSTDEKQTFASEKITFIDYDMLPQFLALQDFIFFSPGVDRTPFFNTAHKWIEEVDIFFEYVKKPVIAITGSVGKTSTVFLLEHILKKQGLRVVACGNSGYPLLSAVLEQDNVDYFIVELSSFQLEHTNGCTPDYALITNLSENHLDRHKTMETYKEAKSKIFSAQKENQRIYLPFELYVQYAQKLETRRVILFDPFSMENNITSKLSDITCIQNWNSICLLLEALDRLPTVEQLEAYCDDFALEHRVEFVRKHRNFAFYNDSKATVPPSTLNALKQFKNQPVILMLGGFSKGIDRKPFIQSLPKNIIHVACFGLEAQELASFCTEINLPCTVSTTIQEAFHKVISIPHTEETVVLFSPSGATHTHEFANYIERGNYFKSLVKSL